VRVSTAGDDGFPQIAARCAALLAALPRGLWAAQHACVVPLLNLLNLTSQVLPHPTLLCECVRVELGVSGAAGGSARLSPALPAGRFGFPLFITVLTQKMGRELSADLGWCDASGGGQPCSQWRSAGFVGPHNISISSGFSSHPFARHGDSEMDSRSASLTRPPGNECCAAAPRHGGHSSHRTACRSGRLRCHPRRRLARPASPVVARGGHCGDGPERVRAPYHVPSVILALLLLPSLGYDGPRQTRTLST